ncbi:endo-1,4-beta-xylanase A precursor [Agarivorans albus MKT 106]|uniref:Endo-1,4-beta-xylanase A n=1 Tax=Agarivorans albus MKT 106 TaxID=1331007 RepID=R9PUC5_AGAAL|nr:endo-1,4-beta-xylanase A precursor [Agarivorans albus MKT 106]
MPYSQAFALGGFGYNNNRFAISADGNNQADNNDEARWPRADPDDWAATPFGLALIALEGQCGNLVHYSYNNFIESPIHSSDINQMKKSVDGSIGFWNYDQSVFMDVTHELNKARTHLANEMAKSTAADPLYFLHAGPAEFFYQAVKEAVDGGHANALNYVYIISHSGYNDDHLRRYSHHTMDDARAYAKGNMNYIRIADQNSGLKSSYSSYYWMRDHNDKSIKFIYDRMQAHPGNVADPSDAGLIWYLFKNDQYASVSKVKNAFGSNIPKCQLSEKPQPPVEPSHAVPGHIQAEKFASQKGIKTEATSDTGGGFNVGYIENGDTAQYKVDVKEAGRYLFKFRVASATNGGAMAIKSNNATLASLNVSGSGGWQNWQTIEQEVTLAKGVQTLSLDFTGGSGYLFNLNWLSAELLESNTGTAYKTHAIPGLIQAEDYDNGGEGVGYSDSNTSNLGGQYRNDGVDIGDAADIGGGQFVGWVEVGEWLQYTISNITQGNYDVNLRLAAAGTSDKSVSLNIDGNALGSVNFKATDGWQNWQTQTLKNVYISGESNQQLRVHMETGALNLNWIEFVPVSNVSVDQCNNTQQCRNEFGSQATDCLNSQSATSICMCGTSQCL